MTDLKPGDRVCWYRHVDDTTFKRIEAVVMYVTDARVAIETEAGTRYVQPDTLERV